MTGKSLRIILVDDHKVLREGLIALINSEPDLEIIADTGDAKQAILLTKELRPDVVVMDLGLPGMGGIQAIREIRNAGVLSHIVVLSMYNDREVVLRAMQAGSDGYVPKSTAHTSLLEAIRVVARGERYLHHSAASVLVDGLADRKQITVLREVLSVREMEVVKFTAMGFTSREIAEKLFLSPKTVDTYRQRAMKKLDIDTKPQLVKVALQAGLLDEFEEHL